MNSLWMTATYANNSIFEPDTEKNVCIYSMHITNICDSQLQKNLVSEYTTHTLPLQIIFPSIWLSTRKLLTEMRIFLDLTLMWHLCQSLNSQWTHLCTHLSTSYGALCERRKHECMQIVLYFEPLQIQQHFSNFLFRE